MNSLHRFSVLFFMCGALISHAVESGNSPLGTWQCSISGSDRGIVYLTFAANSTLSGYGIALNSFGVFTINGTWTMDEAGNVLGAYTETINSVSIPGNFIGRAVSKPFEPHKSRFRAKAIAGNGAFVLKAKSSIPSIAPIDGDWAALVKQSGIAVPQNYTLTETSMFGVYDLSGTGDGPSGIFEIAGAVIVNGWVRSPQLFGFSFSDFGDGDIVAASFAGKFHPTITKGKFKGTDEFGSKLTVSVWSQ